jgi:predicted N-acetyltransferase YhbS
VTENTHEFVQLSVIPEMAEQADQLVEKAFGYVLPCRFRTDFAPLAGAHNLSHRYVLLDRTSQTVVAHVGVNLRSFIWEAETVPVAFLGGIAVDESVRGLGLFHRMFVNVIARYESQCAFFLLWSDKHDMYEKYGFHLAGRQWCYRVPGNDARGSLVRYSELSATTREWMASLYRDTINQRTFSPLRDVDDWRHIGEITSAELRLTGDPARPTGYYFLGKGMDLGGVVHDWAHEDGLEGLLRDSGAPGVVWAAQNADVGDHVRQDLQQLGLWRPNTHAMALQKFSLLLEGAHVTWTYPHFHVRNGRGSWKLLPQELLDEMYSYGAHGLRPQGVPVWVGGLDSV